MAGFHTHITVSTLVGVGYAYVGTSVLGLPLSTCAIGFAPFAGLCPTWIVITLSLPVKH